MESVYLVEPGMKYFMSETLKTCHNKKKEYYNTIYNICFFFIIYNNYVYSIISSLSKKTYKNRFN